INHNFAFAALHHTVLVPAFQESTAVANIKSAKKRAKQTVVRNARNTAQRSQLRTAVKKVLKALDANDAAGAEAAFAVAQPLLDRFSARALIETNETSTQKSYLTARINAIKAAARFEAKDGRRRPSRLSRVTQVCVENPGFGRAIRWSEN